MGRDAEILQRDLQRQLSYFTEEDIRITAFRYLLLLNHFPINTSPVTIYEKRQW